MNPFDIAVIATIIVSALFACVRGFLKEALSIVVWVGAAIVAYYAYPLMLPLAFHLTSEVWLAEAGTAIGTFVAALIILALVSSMVSTSVRGTALGPVDRVLGLLYGAVRGAVIACLLYLGITTIVGETDRPQWFTSAQTLPALARGSAVLETILPASAKAAASETIDASRRAVDNPATAVLGSRPILPQTAPVVTAPPAPVLPTVPPATGVTPPASTGPAANPAATATTAPGMSESDRLMRPPATATQPPPEKPSYRTDDRRAMDRAFQSVQ